MRRVAGVVVRGPCVRFDTPLDVSCGHQPSDTVDGHTLAVTVDQLGVHPPAAVAARVGVDGCGSHSTVVRGRAGVARLTAERVIRARPGDLQYLTSHITVTGNAALCACMNRDTSTGVPLVSWA